MVHAETVAVSIEPTLDREVDAALIASVNLATLFSAETAPDPSSAAWAAAIATEGNRLAAILQSFGYLEARIFPADTAVPTLLRFRPVPGPIYRIGLIEVTGLSDLGFVQGESEIQGMINGAIGAPPRGDLLTGISNTILRHVRDGSYPFAEIAHEVKAHPATATASVRLTVRLGKKVKLGPVSFYGAKATDPQLLFGLHPFSIGSNYTPGALEALRVAVEDLPLVRSARVEIEDRTDANGLAPVRVEIIERGDPIRLGHLKLAGGAALIAALAALSVRQWVQTAQRRPRIRVIQSLDLAVLVLMIFGFALVLDRALGFLE